MLAASGIDTLIGLLPARFLQEVRAALVLSADNAEEIRLRQGYRPVILAAGRETECADTAVTYADIDELVVRATKSSVHAYLDSMKDGYITTDGGHRIGVCGMTARTEGGILTFRKISSACIRIARDPDGIDLAPFSSLLQPDAYRNTVLIAPPGVGKTTLLRALIRALSQTGRVSVADEKGEISGITPNGGGFDLGKHTDVLCGCSKREACMMLLKNMSPEILALDEITSEEDTQAMLLALNCGVRLLATAHAENVQDFLARPIYRPLVEANAVSFVGEIHWCNGKRRYSLKRLERGMLSA